MPFEPLITIPLVATGAALAALGAARLLGRALTDMPPLLALGALMGGIVVMLLGFALPSEQPSGPQPFASLSPVTPGPQPTPAPVEAASLDGRVTAPDGPVADAEVVLHHYERTEEADDVRVRTGGDGRFSFDDLDVGPTIAYRVTVDHRRATFSTDLLFLTPGEERTVDLAVAPPTSSDDAISFDVDSVVYAGDERAAQVIHILRVRNESTEAFAGGLRLPMHTEAAGFTPDRGLDRTRVAVHSGGLVSLAPVLPGETEIVYSYALATGADPIELDRELRYPTRRVTVLVAGDLELDSGVLERADDVTVPAGDLPEREYRSWRAEDLAAGADIDATLAPTQQIPAAVGVGLVLVAIAIAIALFAVPLVRRRRTREPAPDPEPTPVP